MSAQELFVVTASRICEPARRQSWASTCTAHPRALQRAAVAGHAKGFCRADHTRNAVLADILHGDYYAPACGGYSSTWNQPSGLLLRRCRPRTPGISERRARRNILLELTILMPCLNEAETVAVCVSKARRFLERTGIDGEVLVADNGSADGSSELARDAGARIVHIAQKGYGSALLGGIRAAYGKFVIMADADDSYDFSQLDSFVDSLRARNSLVIGHRYRAESDPGQCRRCIDTSETRC